VVLSAPAGLAQLTIVLLARLRSIPRVLLVVASAGLLTACGSGGGGGGSTNLLPNASFTVAPTAGAIPLVVNFDASASTDADGSITGYSWNFGDNSAAATGVTASHTYTTAGAFTATLTVTDNRGATSQTTRTIQATVGPPPASVTVSGLVTYERVPFAANVSVGLDYTRTTNQPVRGAVVQLLGSNQAVLATSATDANGQYSLTSPVSTDVFVRVRAQTVAAGTPSWDISVLNNTNSSALYVMDSSVFNTGIANVTRNLHADSGWPDGFGGTSYVNPRVAAPFAVLDTLYSSVQFVLSQGSPSINLPALKVFWSPENKPSTSWAPATGDIESTLFQSSSIGGFPAGIYVLGWQNVDTDEYDQHVIAHEFQHFLEDALSRSDTPGGSHSGNERLDMRLAFSEGFANAFCAMVLADPIYRDSFGSLQGQSFHFSVESNVADPAGWYNEASVHSLIWDFYDAAADGLDTVQLGYGPIYSVFRNELRTGQALTSIFPFVTALKAQPGAPVAAIDSLVAAQSIRAIDMDAFGTTETNSGGIAESLPIYTNVTLNGSAAQVCGTALLGTYNRLGNRRFVKFSVPSARSITIRVTSNEAGLPVPDPDFILYGDGAPQVFQGDNPNVEQATVAVDGGGYVLEVYEYSHIEPADTNGVSRGTTCMNVTITG
jgi:PKD repeat protein